MENNLTYTRNGDYLIPDLSLSEQPEKPLGKYGRMRKAYLKEHRPLIYNHLLMSEKLYPHLLEIEETANSRLEQMMLQLAESAGATEELKARDSDALGGPDEHLQGTGRGDSDGGAYQQLTLNLFLSEAEQIQRIDEAEKGMHRQETPHPTVLHWWKRNYRDVLPHINRRSDPARKPPCPVLRPARHLRSEGIGNPRNKCADRGIDKEGFVIVRIIVIILRPHNLDFCLTEREGVSFGWVNHRNILFSQHGLQGLVDLRVSGVVGHQRLLHWCGMKHTYQTADVILIIVGSCQPFKFCYSVLLEIGNHIGRGPSTPRRHKADTHHRPERE